MRGCSCRVLCLPRAGVTPVWHRRFLRNLPEQYPCRPQRTQLVRQHSPSRSFSTADTGGRLALSNPSIYALSTAPGRAAIAIVRVSGSACLDIYQALCPRKPAPQPRLATFRPLYKPSDSNQVLDPGALILYFPGPASVTGEDVLELHIHGGPAVTQAILSAIGECNSTSLPVRYAEPGEFTRRAFLNNRLDLTQVEALGETLAAVTEEQRRISVQSSGKGLATHYEAWRQLLLNARGELEALIDFSEDQQFEESPAELAASVAAQVRSLANCIAYFSANAVRGELLRSGIMISLVGAPNVGKSSLLNLIVGRNAAIVSKEAGTTRDVVEVGIDLGGYFCRLGDTAGLRRSYSASNLGQDMQAPQALANIVGEIEQEGIRRAMERAEQSDLVIVLFSVEPSIENQGAQLSIDPQVVETAQSLLSSGKTVVCVVNKVDNYGHEASAMDARLRHAISQVLPDLNESQVFCVSCKDASNSASQQLNAENLASFGGLHTEISDPGNLQAFLTGLQNVFACMTSPLVPDVEGTSREDRSGSKRSLWQESLGVTQRQQALLDECAMHLKQFVGQVEIGIRSETVSDVDPATARASADQTGFDVVMAAECLRAAARCMSKITGRGESGDVEDVLGVVFEK